MFRNLYYSGLIMRLSCYHCPYSNLVRCSDITIADCRGIEKVLPNIKSDEGVSLVIVNIEHGIKLLDFVSADIEPILQILWISFSRHFSILAQ